MKLAAVIVETRPLPNLLQIIQDHLAMLPDYTHLYVFGSYAVEELVKNLDCTFVMVNRVINELEYNKLLTSKEFWNAIDEENVLIFQHDSMLLRKGIEEFYQYDFVGAPLYHIDFPCMNGGLSFRHKSAMFKCLDTVNYSADFHGNEDIHFCKVLKRIGTNLPTKETASMFSVETIYGLGSLGYHAIDKWFKKDQVERIKNQYR